MNLKSIALLFGCAGTLNAVASPKDLSPNEVFTAVAPSIVTVHSVGTAGNEIAQGSGVVVDRVVVVSNCHVIERAASITVGYRGRRFSATPRTSDTERDLCSLNVPGLPAPPVAAGSTSGLSVGDRVYAIGAPQGLDLTLSDGLVSSIRPVSGGRLIQTTAAISHGSSGGGLFDRHGALVGITSMYVGDSQQLNFAVPVEWVSELSLRHKKNVEDKERTARDAVDAWDAALQASDPTGYARRKDRLLARAKQIGSDFPADQWLVEIMKENERLKAADDAEDASAAQAAADAAAAAADAIASQKRDRWVRLSEESNFTAFWDTQSMEMVGGIVKLWVKLVFKENTKERKAGIAEQVSEIQFNCANRTMLWGDWVTYSKSGASIDSGREPYSWDKVKPDSVGERWWHLSCDKPS